MELIDPRRQPESDQLQPVKAAAPEVPVTTTAPAAEAPAVVDELVIEVISIDGMCGVY
jgi:mycofactocin precursor